MNKTYIVFVTHENRFNNDSIISEQVTGSVDFLNGFIEAWKLAFPKRTVYYNEL